MKHKLLLLSVTAALLTGAGINAVSADEDRFTASDPLWKEECGSCHVAYPPKLLAASNWREMMAGLDRHYGSDASLDPKTVQYIGRFLEQNAARERASRRAPSLRITDTRWFRHEHDEVSSRDWKNPRVKSASNCEACHVGAADGNFDEDHIRIPR